MQVKLVRKGQLLEAILEQQEVMHKDGWNIDECKTHLCFEFISHAILCIWYPYSCETHKISSKLGFVGLLMKSK